LLAAEERSRRQLARNAPSRHSRFGTTISIKLNPNKFHPTNDSNTNEESIEAAASSQSFVLHRQQAINRDPGSIMDLNKRQKTKKGNKTDELAREDNLSLEARVVLQALAKEFIGSCFNRV
jgi:replication fork protection complex subunit Tof1/Swi1